MSASPHARRRGRPTTLSSGREQAEKVAATKAEKVARADFRQALADAPWVEPLKRWQAALLERQHAAQRGYRARTAGENVHEPFALPHTVVSKNQGVSSFDEFWVTLNRVLLDGAGDAFTEIDAAVSAPEGPDDPLGPILTA